MRKLSGDNLESSPDKLVMRGVRNKTTVRKDIKCELQQVKTNLETNKINIKEATPKKMYSAQDSFLNCLFGILELAL